MESRYWIVQYKIGYQIEKSYYPPSSGIQLIESFKTYNLAHKYLENLLGENNGNAL